MKLGFQGASRPSSALIVNFLFVYIVKQNKNQKKLADILADIIFGILEFNDNQILLKANF